MAGLLLDSHNGDPSLLGDLESRVSKKLRERIICHKGPKLSTDSTQLTDFFQSYEGCLAREPATSVVVLSSYLVDSFFDSLRGNFDSVRWYEDEPGSVYDTGQFRYSFLHDGRYIEVTEIGSLRKVTEFSRIVELTRDGKRHVIACYPKCGGKWKLRKSPYREVAARGLAGEGDFEFSPALFNSMSMFKTNLKRIRNSPSFAERFHQLTFLSQYESGLLVLVTTHHKDIQAMSERMYDKTMADCAD